MDIEALGRHVTAVVMKVIEKILLVLIIIATLSAIGEELSVIYTRGSATLGDLLLLFIYLEIMSMVAVCSRSGRVPVRVPIYIAIVAIARVLIVDMKNMEELRIIGMSLSTLILAFTVIVIRWGQLKLPYSDNDDGEVTPAEKKKEKPQLKDNKMVEKG